MLCFHTSISQIYLLISCCVRSAGYIWGCYCGLLVNNQTLIFAPFFIADFWRMGLCLDDIVYMALGRIWRYNIISSVIVITPSNSQKWGNLFYGMVDMI